MRVIESSPGDLIRTQSGQFLKTMSYGFHNDLGVYAYPKDYDEECELVNKNQWALWEHEFFQLVRPSSLRRHVLPHDVLLFRTDRGFRFRVRLNNYKMVIPFSFRSTDSRVPVAHAVFESSSGKVPQMIVDDASLVLCVTYDEAKPRLHFGIKGSIISK